MPVSPSLASSARRLASVFLDCVYPNRCMVCENLLEFGAADWVCRNCAPLLVPISGPVCEKCGKPLGGGECNEGYEGGDECNGGYECNERYEGSGKGNKWYGGKGNGGNESNKGYGGGNAEAGALCRTCARRERFFGKNTAFFPYDPVVRELIHRFKYGGRPRYAVGLARMICGRIGPEFWRGADAFAAVPMYPRKKKERGYNQAEELALAVSGLTGVPVDRDCLARVSDTKPQSGLGPAARANNVRDAFKAGKSRVPAARSYIIFDDVYTTGETISACARVLLENGAGRADGFTLAIAVGEKKKDKA
ncbi:MAG: ComF family protein [Firmicutes bacterium]|nr:ComF family protein [Bacillota bacterium]